MELIILDDNLESIAVIDSYTSLIWTDRYFDAGDFELYLPVTEEVLGILKPDRFVYNNDSFSIYTDENGEKHKVHNLMIIEEVRITSDIEDGNNLCVVGRSLVTLLNRRIVWAQTNFEATGVETAIKRLFSENIEAPSIVERILPNCYWRDSNDSSIDTLTITGQYLGQNIFDAIRDICQQSKVGFFMGMDDDDRFIFQLFRGADRSFKQTSNSYVIFSPEFENIINSEYSNIKTDYKNVALVGGEENGSNKTLEVAGDYTLNGMARRETYTDGSSVSKTTESKTLSTAEYKAKLLNVGEKALKDAREKRNFDGEIEASQTFLYGTDFFMGDVVEFADSYGNEARTRVVEYIIKQDDNGYSAYPTCEVVEEDSRLPAIYQEVEYIGANKGPYINTTLKEINGFDILFSTADTDDCSIFGSKDNNAIKKAIDWAVSIAKDSSHGYSQYNRWGPDYDCSSFVIQAFQNAKVPVKTNGATYTGDMYNVFLRTGFEDVTSQVSLSTGAGLKMGDVLLDNVRKYNSKGELIGRGHTALYIGNNQIVQATVDEKGGVRGDWPGDQTGGEIGFAPFPGYSWPFIYVLRYTGTYGDKIEFSLSVDDGKVILKPENYQIVSAAANADLYRRIKYGSNTNKKIYLNDALQYQGTAERYTKENVNLLFAITDDVGDPSNFANARIKHARFFKTTTGQLVMDLVPCYRKTDNVIGMYDLCGNICPLTDTAFFINSGSGAFTKGNDVVDET